MADEAEQKKLQRRIKRMWRAMDRDNDGYFTETDIEKYCAMLEKEEVSETLIESIRKVAYKKARYLTSIQSFLNCHNVDGLKL